MKSAGQRIVLALGLVMALAMAALGGDVRSTAAQGGGSLAIYSYACPAGFDGGDYNGCRSTPLSGVGFTVVEAGQGSAVGATSDADGVANIGLPFPDGSTVNVFVQAPAGYESAYLSCSQEYGAIEGGITFASVVADAFVTCEWFFVPVGSEPPVADEDGSLAVYVFGCPAGFDGEDYSECEGRPVEGVNLTTAAAGQDNGVGGTTDPSGTAWFPLFAADLPGDINLHVSFPEEYAQLTAACWSSTGTDVDVAYTQTGVTLLSVPDGAEVACGLYLEHGQDEAVDGDGPESITTMPNTGTGDFADKAADNDILAALLGMTIAIAAGLIGRRSAGC